MLRQTHLILIVIVRYKSSKRLHCYARKLMKKCCAFARGTSWRDQYSTPLTLPSPQGEGITFERCRLGSGLVAIDRCDGIFEQHSIGTAAADGKPSPRGEGRVRGIGSITLFRAKTVERTLYFVAPPLARDHDPDLDPKDFGYVWLGLRLRSRSRSRLRPGADTSTACTPIRVNSCQTARASISVNSSNSCPSCPNPLSLFV
jgi:hypothetical protein